MAPGFDFKRINTILYCQKWEETVNFYRHRLNLPVTFETDWFVEFQIEGPAYLSVANENRASIQSSAGAGLTLALQVEEIEQTWRTLQQQNIAPGPIKTHAWGGRVFYFYDPEGHRLEVWSTR